MKEYSGLGYKTYNNIKFKRDYSRVYFCSHNIDLKNCLEDISKEVWDIKKTITFWYKDFGVDYYENDIIMVRNNLAHCISYQEGNKEILKVKKEGMPDIIFDSEKFKTIRANIKKYKELFNIVLSHI